MVRVLVNSLVYFLSSWKLDGLASHVSFVFFFNRRGRDVVNWTFCKQGRSLRSNCWHRCRPPWYDFIGLLISFEVHTCFALSVKFWLKLFHEIVWLCIDFKLSQEFRWRFEIFHEKFLLDEVHCTSHVFPIRSKVLYNVFVCMRSDVHIFIYPI